MEVGGGEAGGREKMTREKVMESEGGRGERERKE